MWLEESCRKQGLSLRQAANKTGLSHATIADIKKGNHPSPETLRKLAGAFSGDGEHERRALEDKLLTIAGYRSKPLEEEEITEPMARLLDKLGQFSEPQLKIISHFADFISEMGAK